jgi:hypothetical protein
MSDDRVQEILNEIRDLKFEFIEFKTKIETELIAKGKECDYHKERLVAIDKIIHGNGQKGLKQQMAEIETKMAIISGLGSVIGSSLITLFWRLLVR